MTCLIDFQDSLDPGNDLVGTWVGWLVEVDHTILLEDVNWPVQGRVSTWQWSEMIGLNIQLIIVL